MVAKEELMVNDIFELNIDNNLVRISVNKIGKNSVDVYLEGNVEKVCPIDYLVPIKLNDYILTNDCKFDRRQIKLQNGDVNDLFKMIDNDQLFVSLVKVNEKYNISIKTVNGVLVCEANNIEYLHTLQNIIRSTTKKEICLA